MSKRLNTILASLVFVAVCLSGVLLPALTFATHTGNPADHASGNPPVVNPPTTGNPPVVNPPASGNQPPGTALTVQLKNPLKYNTLVDFLRALLDILLVFAVPIIVFFLILSGFKFVMARGNESELSAAKTMFTWTVVGGVLVLGAWALVAVIQGTVNALR